MQDMETPTKIAIVGAGTIGLSFLKLHLTYSPKPVNITIFDTRPDLEEYVAFSLGNTRHKDSLSLVKTTKSLAEAVSDASIVQEQGPENLPFKAEIWPQIEVHAPATALLWSSTSGIPASAQSKDMKDPTRLLVVHPYNPPHVMPLLEVVPSPSTSQDVIDRTLHYWKSLGRAPVVIKQECTGFVANRLAFVLLREAIHLVKEGIVTVEELDKIVETSMGPRWAVAGPFKSYHAGGGKGGLEAFFTNIGGTVQGCWDDSGKVNVGDGWEENVFRQTKEAYGVVDTAVRDRITKRVIDVVTEEKERK
jgi:3-hydroxyacyl-CoA dehydrogenase